MKISSFSAHIPSLAYYIFIGATNSAKNFFRTIWGLQKASQVHFPANLTALEVTKYESLDYVYVQHTRKLANACDVFPDKDE